MKHTVRYYENKSSDDLVLVNRATIAFPNGFECILLEDLTQWTDKEDLLLTPERALESLITEVLPTMVKISAGMTMELSHGELYMAEVTWHE